MHIRALLVPFLLLTACSGPPADSISSEDDAIIYDPDDPDLPDRCPSTNPCVERSWTGSRCVDTRLPNGTPCFDGNVCDGTSTCRLGRCISDNVPISCEDGNACTSDWCDPSTGCHSRASSGNACSDGSACTVADVCQAGRCVGFGNTQGVPTVPSFSDVSLYSPFGELVEYLGNNYLEGEALDIRFTLPSCTYVTGVLLDGAAIDTRPHTQCDDASGSVDCQPAYYEIVWAFPRSNGTLDTIVRVHFGGPGSSGDAVSLAVIARSDVGQAQLPVTVARVLDVIPRDDPRQRLVLTISETRLSNGFIQGTYARFGDVGRMVDDEGHALINPNYSGRLIEVEPAGLHLVTRVTVDATCHPSARVEGRFVLVKTDSDLDIVWTQGPSIPITIDPLCNIVTLGIVDIIADFVYDDEALEMVNKQVKEQVNAALGESCDALCLANIDRFEYTDDEIRVLIRPSADSAIVEVPSWKRAPSTPLTHGFPVTPNAPYVFLGSGIGRINTCRSGSTSPVCGATYAVGPDGTFLWERDYDAANGAQIPDPWYNPDGPAAYFAERAAARDRLRGAYRDLALIPNERLNAGALVVRGASSTLRSVGDPCAISAGATTTRLAFGVNEANDGTYESGTRRVAVIFAPGVGIRTCPN